MKKSLLKCSITLVLMVLNAWIFMLLFPQVKSSGNNIQNILERIVVSVIAAPIIETYLIQVLILDTSIKYLKLKDFFAIFLAAITFGALHHSHWAYVLKTFIDTFFLSYLYLSFKPNQYKAFLLTSLVHAIYNLIAIFS